MNTVFKGFSPESLTFFEQLSHHNTKAWFEEHRDDYEEFLLAPLKALVSDLAETMRAIDDELVTTPAVDKTISRIYRDTRFSRNKAPYKTRLWITFKRRSPQWQGSPCFFFEISADGCCYGMGFYAAERTTMDNLRRFIETRPEEFRAIVSCLEGDPPFTLEGETYKRPLNPALAADLQEWHRRKNVYLICYRPADGRLFTPGICDELRRGFQLLAPVYGLFRQVSG